MTHELVRTFHSTCMVRDYDRTVAALGRLIGLRVLEYSELEYIGRRGGMTWFGDGSIEVAQPIVAEHAAQKFVDRFGAGMHSYAFQVADLDATLDHLAAVGVRLGVRPKESFCFTDPRTTGGLLFEWAQHTVPEDPRIGAAEPAYVVDPLLDVRTNAFVGAVVADPVEWAETFGAAFGLVETFRNVRAPAGHPAVGLAAPDCTLALYALPGDASEELWGAAYGRARFHALGVGVPNLTDAVAALADAAVPVRRVDDQFVVVEPSAAGDVCLVVMEGLLPGDPRAGTGQSTTAARA